MQQLELLLAWRRLVEEQNNLHGKTNAVTAVKEGDSKAVDPTVYMLVKVCSVLVEAMVDTGSQSTIISRSLQQEIGRSLQQAGKPLPELELPMARHFGRDGAGGSCELLITAQLNVTIEADGESACIPVFVQLESKQKCLLGMNALPALGFTLLCTSGTPIVIKSKYELGVAHVRLIETVNLPSLKACFAKVQLDPNQLGPGTRCNGSHVLFEPSPQVLESVGLQSHESLVTLCEGGCMLVTLMNVQGSSASLNRGINIGCAHRVRDPSEPKCISSEYETRNGKDSVCASLGTMTANNSEHLSKLVQALGMSEAQLTAEQRHQLRDLLNKYSYLFALCDAELSAQV